LAHPVEFWVVWGGQELLNTINNHHSTEHIQLPIPLYRNYVSISYHFRHKQVICQK